MIKKLANTFKLLLVLGMIVTPVFLCCNLSTTRVLSSSSTQNSLLSTNLEKYSVFSDDFNDDLNGGISWNLLASDLIATSYQMDTTTVEDSSNYLVKVVATCADGLTTEDVSDAVFTIQNSIPSFNIFQLLIPVIIFISFLFIIFVIFSGPIRRKWVTSSASEDKTKLYSRAVPYTTKEAAIPKEVPVKGPRLSKDVVSRESVEPSLQANHRVPDTSQDVSMNDLLLCAFCGSKLLQKGDQFCVYCGKSKQGYDCDSTS